MEGVIGSFDYVQRRVGSKFGQDGPQELEIGQGVARALQKKHRQFYFA